MSKKGWGVVLAVLIIFLFAFSVTALGNEGDETETIYVGMHCIEVDAGLSQEKRTRLSELMQMTNFIPEGVVVDIQSCSMFEGGAPGAAITRAPIPSSQFTNEIVCQRLTMSGYDAFKLSAVGVWHTTPSIRLDDIMAVAWSGDFTLYDDSARTFYKDIWENTTEFSGKAVRSDVSPAAGVAYSVPLFVQTPNVGYSLWYIQMDAYIRKPNSTGTANAVVKYAHKKVGGNITVTYSKTPSIGFSGVVIDQISSSDYCEWDY